MTFEGVTLMKKKHLILSSVAVVVLLAFNACDSTTRYDRHSDGIVSDNPDVGSVISDNPNSVTIIDINSTTPDQNVTIKAADNVYEVYIAPEESSLTNNQAQTIHYEIKDLFTGKAASNDSIEKIEFTVDSQFAKFINYDGSEGNTFTLTGSKAGSIGNVAIKSLTNSGQVNVNFKVTINGITKELTKRFPVVIIKNQSSSISMIPVPKYAAYDKYNNGLYVDKFTLHIVDKYGNKAKDGTYVHVGTVNNLKQDLGVNLYSSQLNTTGTFTAIENSFSFDNNHTLTDVTSDNELAVDDRDTIVILPNAQRSDPRYLGGWRIESIEDNKSLKMWDAYTWAEDKTGLSFVIGDDKKFNSCDSTLANAAIYSETDYKVKDGIVNIELRYGPYMVGKSVFLYANSLIDGERIGISRKIDLEGTGIADMSYTCDASDKDLYPSGRDCSWTGYLKFNDSDVTVKNVNVGRRTTKYGILGASNRFIACDGAAHETIHAEAGKNVSITVKYVIEPELP